MKAKKHPLSLFIVFLSIFTLALMLVGLGLAVKDILQPQKNSQLTIKQNTTSKTDSSKSLILGLGDSLTRGEGDEQGLGYFGMVRDELKKKNPTLQAANLAIRGQTSSQLREQLNKPQAQNLIRQAKWITLTIGGNDLNRGSGGLEKLNENAANESKKIYLANVQDIIEQIRSLNKDVTLFIFGLYNPYGDLDQNEVTNRVIFDWNESLQKITLEHPATVVVPTFDLFQQNPKKYLFSDHFHPNKTGYQRMATRLLQIIKDSN